MIQLDLLSYIEAPVVIKKTPAHTITRTPNKGYKVVLAPGLTTAALRNPCLSCDVFGRNMDACASSCKQSTARSSYLEAIGAPDLAGVDTEGGAYGFGC